MGFIFVTHGMARIYHNSVADFGNFIATLGLPFGELLAWLITIGELIGGMLLITGYFIRYVIPFHFIVILTGIFTVHLKHGWFVVGHGQNGIEYSVLILAVLGVLFIHSKK